MYHVADKVSFFKAFRKMAEQHHPDKVNVCKDKESISGTLMMYVLKGSLGKEKKRKLYSPAALVTHMLR